jgi:hypothetical protein
VSDNVLWCEQLTMAVSDADVPIVYESKVREIGLSVGDGGSAYLLLEFCPFCGSKLPPSLRDRWFDQLELSGFEPGDFDIPVDLTTDRWWRGGI